MSTANEVELLIVTIILSLFFLILCIFLIQLIGLVRATNRLYKKAESLIKSAESAAETIAKLGFSRGQKFPLLGLITHIFDNATKSKDK